MSTEKSESAGSRAAMMQMRAIREQQEALKTQKESFKETITIASPTTRDALVSDYNSCFPNSPFPVKTPIESDNVYVPEQSYLEVSNAIMEAKLSSSSESSDETPPRKKREMSQEAQLKAELRQKLTHSKSLHNQLNVLSDGNAQLQRLSIFATTERTNGGAKLEVRLVADFKDTIPDTDRKTRSQTRHEGNPVNPQSFR